MTTHESTEDEIDATSVDCKGTDHKIDLTELGVLKTTRALRDPFILHEKTKDWERPTENKLYRDVKAARLKQNIEIPVEDRIEFATWPETLLYLSTLTMDSEYVNSDLGPVYRYVFRRYVDDWTDLVVDEQPPIVSSPPGLTGVQKERLNDLRFGIKKDRDVYFVNEMYDDIGVESVPKRFWATEYEQEHGATTFDKYARSATGGLTDEN